MSKTICIILRQAPYGHLDAAKAIRHLAGALANGFSPVGLLIDDGVYLAKPGHPTTAGWINLSAALTDLRSETATRPNQEAGRAVVAVHGPSLRRRDLNETDLAPGWRVVDDAEAATLVGLAGSTLVF